VKVILKIRKAPGDLSEIVCTQPVTSIGRKDVDVRINDLDLSRKHCAIEIMAGTQVMIRDLGSTNGTYLNGKKISTQEVKNGDLIQIGQSLLEVLIQRS
jgi:pSer/pThr/pTyr-binding forkhead associated (FHA) protein